VGSGLKTFFEIFFTQPLKNLAGKTSNLADLLPTRHQSEAHNFKTAQHIEKQKIYLSSTTNALKTVSNLGHQPTA